MNTAVQEALELVEVAVRRTRSRCSGGKILYMLDALADEICRIAMEESGGNEDED